MPGLVTLKRGLGITVLEDHFSSVEFDVCEEAVPNPQSVVNALLE